MLKHWAKKSNKLTGKKALDYLQEVMVKAKVQDRELVAGYVPPLCPCACFSD